MKKLLLMLVLSFLVFLNIRLLGGVREAELLLQERCGRRTTCDIAYDTAASNSCLQSKSLHATFKLAEEQSSQEVELPLTISKGEDVQDHSGKVLHDEVIQEVHLEPDEQHRLHSEKNANDQSFFSRVRNLATKLAVYRKCKKNRQSCGKVSVWADDEVHYERCPSYASIKEIFSKSLSEFLETNDRNELVLHQLLELIHNELDLIEVLIYPVAGSSYMLMKKRHTMLDNSIPSIRAIYDKLLNLVTYSAQLNDQYVCQKEHEGSKLFLGIDNKKIFLHTVYQRLSDLKQKIQGIQYQKAIH